MNLPFQRSLLQPGTHPTVIRRLGDLQDCYAEPVQETLADTLVYEVHHFSSCSSDGHLLIGLCTIYPGVHCDQYFMTKGHRHVVPRAEIYLGVSGTGLLVMQHETTREIRTARIEPAEVVYVPPLWAHRQVNVGEAPLITFFAVASDAGQDYDFVRRYPFQIKIVRLGNGPAVVDLTKVEE
jgi:glucose-6-phosphate isomerase, archaeal